MNCPSCGAVPQTTTPSGTVWSCGSRVVTHDVRLNGRSMECLLLELARLRSRVEELEALSVPRAVALQAGELAFEYGWNEGLARIPTDTTHSNSAAVAGRCLEAAEAEHADRTQGAHR